MARFAGTLVALALIAAPAAAELPFERTEERPEFQPNPALGGTPTCPDPGPETESSGYDPLRQPFFGDTHVHTSYSIDAFVFDVRNDPTDAYAFAKGEPLPLTKTDENGDLVDFRLERPLDFAAVTDHAEGIGNALICLDPNRPGYDAPECIVFRNETPLPPRASLILLIGTVSLYKPLQLPMCHLPWVDCHGATISAWQDTLKANEEAYEPCRFTSFNGYEWTSMPGTFNLHRNVVFRNDRVPSFPTSNTETDGPHVDRLWDALENGCLRMHQGELTTTTGCDVLTIPHNSNLSGGMMFPDPKGKTPGEKADFARRRRFFEPLVEILQHKSSSECLFDERTGNGVGTTDEECSFERPSNVNLLPLPGPNPKVPLPAAVFDRRSFTRTTLQDGLAIGEAIGENPFKFGLVGSTDGHNGMPGATNERTWEGHAGNQDVTEEGRVSDGALARTNPGGLAVVWAEENSRDSVFAAMRRREAYGTSGTRPVVRLFAGRGFGDANTFCALDEREKAAAGYEQGVPMGGDLPSDLSGAPQLAVWAWKDPGTTDVQGTDLERIQIIKGWVDSDGDPHEAVVDVVDFHSDSGEGTSGIAPIGLPPFRDCTPDEGAAHLCTVWEDPDFDPSVPAVYYARILERPSCRWSTFQCQSQGVDPFAYDLDSPTGKAECLVDARTVQPGTDFTPCCTVDPVIRERAWTSPVWYTP